MELLPLLLAVAAISCSSGIADSAVRRKRVIGSSQLSEISARFSAPTTVATATIGRRELLLWIVVCLFANQALLLLDVQSFDAFAASLLTQNDIYWLACAVVIYRLNLSDRTVGAGRLDWVLALAVGILLVLSSLLPYRFGIGLLTTLVALYLVLLDHADRNLKAAGAVLLALSMQLVWGPIFFQLFTPELLAADAALVGSVLTVLRPDIVWNGTTFFAPDGHAVSLIAACSSFNNVSTAVLACAAVIMLRRVEWMRSDTATMAIAATAMMLVNAARICLFAWSSDYHAYWHDGAGAQILAIAQTLVVLAIAWRGAAPSRPAP
jgi:transmembrane exosortase EpsH